MDRYSSCQSLEEWGERGERAAGREQNQRRVQE